MSKDIQVLADKLQAAAEYLRASQDNPTAWETIANDIHAIEGALRDLYTKDIAAKLTGQS